MYHQFIVRMEFLWRILILGGNTHFYVVCVPAGGDFFEDFDDKNPSETLVCNCKIIQKACKMPKISASGGGW